MRSIRKDDTLVRHGGYQLTDPWSRVVVYVVDDSLRQVGLLPHTTKYVKNFKPGLDGNFSVRWMQVDKVFHDYMIEEHAK